MAKLTSLGKWRDGEGWTQHQLADKLGVPRPTFQKMESGVGPIPPKIQTKIRKLEYTGPWPREEAKESAGGVLTREEFAEWRGYLKAGMEGVLKRLDDLEGQVRKLSQNGESV